MKINSCILIRQKYEAENIQNLIKQLMIFSESIYICDTSDTDDCRKEIEKLGLIDIILWKKESNIYDDVLTELTHQASENCDLIFWCNGYDELMNGLIDHIINDFVEKDIHELDKTHLSVPYIFDSTSTLYRNEIRFIDPNTNGGFWGHAYPLFDNSTEYIDFNTFDKLFESIIVNQQCWEHREEYAKQRIEIQDYDEYFYARDTHLRYAVDLMILGKNFLASNILTNIVRKASSFERYTPEERIYALYKLRDIYQLENSYHCDSILSLAELLWKEGIRRADLSTLLGSLYLEEQSVSDAYIHYNEAIFLGNPSPEYRSYYNKFSHDEEAIYNLTLIELYSDKVMDAYIHCSERISTLDESNPYSEFFDKLLKEIENKISVIEQNQINELI